MNYRWIDMEHHPRRAHFNYFRSLPSPMAGVTVNVDVTELYDFARAQGVSFFMTFLHAAALAADGVPELRRRIRDGGVVEYDACGTSHIELLEDGSYCYCTLHHHMPWAEYVESAAAARKRCRENPSIEEDEDVESLYFITSLPWLHYTQLLQPTAGGDESNPRISWGRFKIDREWRRMMPVTLLAHHGLVDGIHMARFYENLEDAMRAIYAGNAL